MTGIWEMASAVSLDVCGKLCGGMLYLWKQIKIYLGGK